MGFFYVDNSEEESVIAERQRKEEIREIAQATLELARKAPDDLFPDFLWSVQMNEYERDDYRLRGTCENPNVLKAYEIRGKYSDYWDYLDALEAYMDYVDYIDSAYGSFAMMQEAAKDGISIIYIPKKPKLNNKKKNRNMIQAEFVPSRVDEDFELTEDQLQAAINAVPVNEISFSETYQLPKVDRKIQKQMLETKAKFDRINSIYKYGSDGYMEGMDAIVSFLNSSNTTSIEERANKYKSFTEEVEHLHDDDLIPEDVLNDEFQPAMALIRDGFLSNPNTKRQIDLINALEANGFAFLNSDVAKNMPKRAIHASMKKYGVEIDYSKLTPKEIKKLKKRQAKERRKENERLIGDRRLQDALLRNRVQYTRDDNLNFRLCDVIPDE